MEVLALICTVYLGTSRKGLLTLQRAVYPQPATSVYSIGCVADILSVGYLLAMPVSDRESAAQRWSLNTLH